MKTNKKIIFTFNVDNVIDIITNSSSELFVLKGETKGIVEEMITNVYANYKDEYEEIKNSSDLTLKELDNYFDYACSSYFSPCKPSDLPVLPGFNFDELYQKETDYKTGQIKEPAWNGEYQYELKDNTTRKMDNEWHFGSLVTEENKEEILNKLDPNRSMYFLFSIDENPNYEMQQKLETIGEHFHLG